MIDQTNEPHFVTCACRVCNKHIEFDASDLAPGETRNIECPHCNMETVLFVPQLVPEHVPPILPRQSTPPPRIIDPPPIQPIPIENSLPTLEIRLTSGTSFDVVAICLFDEAIIEELKAKSAEAIQRIEEAAQGDCLEAKKELRKLSSRGTAFQKQVRPWDVSPTGLAGVLGLIEPFMAQSSYKTAMQLLKEVKEGEAKLYQTGVLFHISRIGNLAQPVPGYWRAVINGKAYVSDGSGFVTIQDGKQNDSTIAWSAVECFNYKLTTGRAV